MLQYPQKWTHCLCWTQKYALCKDILQYPHCSSSSKIIKVKNSISITVKVQNLGVNVNAYGYVFFNPKDLGCGVQAKQEHNQQDLRVIIAVDPCVLQLNL